MTTETLLERYESLIDDPEAFASAIAQPLPTCIRVNPLKTTSVAVKQFLESQHLWFEPLSWYPDAFRIRNWEKPGLTLPFASGWYNLQEEIALTAVKVLDPQPGERVIDLCAAPGGKTVQIATRLQGTGMVVANEAQISRLSQLRAMLDRIGVSNVMMSNYDGTSIPLQNHSFDRVLVDVPCSGEGTLRKGKMTRKQHRLRYSEKIATTQKKLLHRALQLVKPNGIIVYSTCTFAPEENEAVIDAVLGERGILESAAISHLKGMSGLQQWQGQTFRKDLVEAQRYFPHFNDTGGFFVARIRRSESHLEPTAAPNEVSREFQPQEVENARYLQWFSERFGIDPDVFSSFQLWKKGQDKFWLADLSCQPTFEVEIQTLGIPLMRTSYKPTTCALQRFGSDITRNVVSLDDFSAVKRFFLGESQAINASVESGFVHVRYDHYELGCGISKNGLLHSQIPKGLRLKILA
ncbi:RNA methylase, NOL1/NOP2/sun family [Halothece sp. PCC 7418]|uniref:RsmB/NOP family class I SAM-dependent RNA methyltransferase n=1 Tax=Halothece sp. (strain PCC 7418) TaxID=65093 RepID=UPI0002A06AAD|nr:RsmB/NOP family class I SAM-dependent RNA methyltransferase [Halothece sp. PCC 7418]AFZ44215.1 RNA methylase, NOL1/NOP2/sun family [Halothece sp. PCC 7418]